VAHLEGQVSELSVGLADIRTAVGRLEERMDVRFQAVDRRFDALDEKISRQFVWLVGIIVTALAAMLGAVLSR
jgi:hypothetical protein